MSSDLINRQALCDDLREYKVHPVPISSDESEVKGYNDGIDLAISVIAKFPSAESEQKWIPVSEALPENTEFVLLTIRRLDKSYNQIPFISVGYVSWNQTAWWCAHDGDCDAHNVEVLAWMPLPEPYRAERRTDETD